MELEMVLNELSLQPLAGDIPEARQRMSALMGTIKAATSSGVSRSLRTPENLKSEQIAFGYSIGRWLKDHEVDLDTRRYFTSLALRASYLVGITDQAIVDKVENAEFFCNEDCAMGLGVAYCLDALALSIRSEVRWHPHYLELKHTYLDGDGESILNEDIIVTHASQKDHILQHQAWIKERISSDIQDGADLWKYRERQFPSLQFCASVGEALQSLNAGNSSFHLIARKLGELENACQEWQKHEGTFDIQRKGSVDSEATLLKYSKERTFYCPDEQTRLFSLHIRINRDWRIYYYLLGETKQLVIGYVGKHLPTVKHS